MKSKKILYIGNNLSEKTNYTTTMETLSNLLFKENFIIYKSSNKKNKFLRLLDMCWSLIYFNRSLDFVLIDTFSTKNFYFAFVISQLARVFNIKYIPILHGGNLPYRIDSSKFYSKLIFNNSYANVAPSNYLKNAFEKRGYKVDFIPNVLEIEKYNFKERKKLKPNLLWVRAFKDIYNPALAIEVLFLLKKRYPSANLCMIGPNNDASYMEVKKLIDKYKLQNSVEITGVLSKEEWHEKSTKFDILINTTNIDNTPVSIMEAMALGLVVVSTNAGGIPFLIDDGFTGLIVEKDNPEEMTNAVLRILSDNNTLITKNAFKKVQSFGWQEVRVKWLNLLN